MERSKLTTLLNSRIRELTIACDSGMGTGYKKFLMQDTLELNQKLKEQAASFEEKTMLGLTAIFIIFSGGKKNGDRKQAVPGLQKVSAS